MTDLPAAAAGDTLLRVDPLLVVFKANCVCGAFHAAAMAAGAIPLVNYIGHLAPS